MLKTSPAEAVAESPSSGQADQSIVLAAKGGGIVLAGSFFVYGIRFVITILLTRLLGAEQFGLYRLSITTATILGGIALLGLGPALVRYVAVFVSRRDTSGLIGTLQLGLGLTTIMSLLLAGGLYILADPVAERLFQEPKLAPLLRLSCLIIPLLSLSDMLAAATQGFKRMQYTVIAMHISEPLLKLTLIGMLGVVGLSAEKALVAFAFSLLAACAMLLHFLNSLFPLKRSLRLARRNVKEILGFSLPVYLSDLIRTFSGNIQTLLLGALNTATTVGIFAAASQINRIGVMFHGAFVTASSPIVSELHDQVQMEQLGRFYQTVTKWTFTVNVPLFLIIVLFPQQILSVFGEDFTGGTTALFILAWANLVQTGTGICGVILDMTGNTVMKMVNSIASLVFTLGLSILLIPRWGLTGAAAAALISAIVVNLLRLSEVYVLFRLLPYNLSFLKPIVAALVALVIAIGSRLLSPSEANLVAIAVNIAVFLVTYGVLILLLGLSQEDKAVLARVSQRARAALQK